MALCIDLSMSVIIDDIEAFPPFIAWKKVGYFVVRMPMRIPRRDLEDFGVGVKSGCKDLSKLRDLTVHVHQSFRQFPAHEENLEAIIPFGISLETKIQDSRKFLGR